jgi:hypothetical protein
MLPLLLQSKRISGFTTNTSFWIEVFNPNGLVAEATNAPFTFTK